MNTSVKVKKAEIKHILKATFPEYSGRKFKVEFTNKVWFHDTVWGGGSKNSYRFLRVDGHTGGIPNNISPWNNPFEGESVEMNANTLVVEHSYFCGHDMGITIYAHTSLQPKWLPAA